MAMGDISCPHCGAMMSPCSAVCINCGEFLLKDFKPKKEKTMDKFWMVYNPFGKMPGFKHLSLDSALKEAERLCRKEGHGMIVLEAIKIVNFQKPPIEIEDLKEKDANENAPF